MAVSFDGSFVYKYRKFDSAGYIWRLLKYGQLAFSDPTSFNDIFDTMLQTDLPDKEIKQNVDSWRKQLRICCMSKTSLSPLMWATYGDLNSGVCIEFHLKSDHQGHKGLALSKGDILPAYSVEYNDCYSYIVTSFDDIPIEAILTKNKVWKAEEEVRFILKEDRSQICTAPKIITLENGSITKIILGSKSPSIFKEMIMEFTTSANWFCYGANVVTLAEDGKENPFHQYVHVKVLNNSI